MKIVLIKNRLNILILISFLVIINNYKNNEYFTKKYLYRILN